MMYLKDKFVTKLAVYSIDNNPDAEPFMPVTKGAALRELVWCSDDGYTSAMDQWTAVGVANSVIGGRSSLGLAALVNGVWTDTDGGTALSDFRAVDFKIPEGYYTVSRVIGDEDVDHGPCTGFLVRELDMWIYLYDWDITRISFHPN